MAALTTLGFGAIGRPESHLKSNNQQIIEPTPEPKTLVFYPVPESTPSMGKRKLERSREKASTNPRVSEWTPTR